MVTIQGVSTLLLFEYLICVFQLTMPIPALRCRDSTVPEVMFLLGPCSLIVLRQLFRESSL